MKNTVSIIRKELNRFLGNNRVNTKMLYSKQFKTAYQFPVSGRTVYRITVQKATPTIRTQKKILERLGLEFKEEFNRIEVLNYGK
jgi:hypothetical protein